MAAEKGYLRETGNLVFHLALVVLLVGVAVGALFGTHGDGDRRRGRRVREHGDRGTTRSAPGGSRAPTSLPPFSFTLDSFTATYERGGPQDGAPRTFTARLTVRDDPASAPQRR